jgi:hypothetical protein
MLFPSFHVAYIETLANSITFIFEPFGNFFKNFGRIPQQS